MKVLGLFLHIFPCLEAFESNITFDWIRFCQSKHVLLSYFQNDEDKDKEEKGKVGQNKPSTLKAKMCIRSTASVFPQR